MVATRGKTQRSHSVFNYVGNRRPGVSNLATSLQKAFAYHEVLPDHGATDLDHRISRIVDFDLCLV